MKTYFVVRDTDHPAEDLERNWSAMMGGFDHPNLVYSEFASEEDAKNAWDEVYDGCTPCPELRWHPGHNSFVPVHYEGLGAWELQAETLEEAIKEAAKFDDYLACTMEAGDGHFDAKDCVSYHKVRDGKYVFEIKATW